MADDQTPKHATVKEKREARIVEKVLALVKEHPPQASTPSSDTKSEHLTRFVGFMESLRTITASALLAAALAAIYEYLALLGITDTSPAKVVLIAAGFFGVLFLWECLSFLKWGLKKRLLAIGPLIVICSLGLFLLDRWARDWKLKHPPDIVEIQRGFHEIGASIDQLTAKTNSPQVTTNHPQIKNITANPGYLKLVFTYPRLPVEQVNKPMYLNVNYYNLGETYVHRASMRAALFFVNFGETSPAPRLPEVDKNLSDALAKVDSTARTDIAPGDAIWDSLNTPVLSQEMFDKMNAGTTRLYFVGEALWTNTKGLDHVKSCFWLQPATWRGSNRPDVLVPDETKVEPVWHLC